MPTSITSAGITFNDATSLTSGTLVANSVGTTQLAANSVTAAKLGATEQKQICKAWVNFNGTVATPSTIRSSYNVSSVTKNGTGDYTVNFAASMADVNYSANVTTGANATSNARGSDGPKTTANIQVFCRDVYNNSQYDTAFINVTIFGN
jgi:hypothetical protein